ncbi:Laminin subunit [Trichinella spiralis]|uniref:Laminin subunit n=1 Tax=Trichinella spiralis TaxID=6334 RepID=A0ABR3KSM6_TRISP
MVYVYFGLLLWQVLIVVSYKLDLNSECKTSHDCKKQTICVNGKCKVAATIGKQCKVDSDCDDGQSCRFGVSRDGWKAERYDGRETELQYNLMDQAVSVAEFDGPSYFIAPEVWRRALTLSVDPARAK